MRQIFLGHLDGLAAGLGFGHDFDVGFSHQEGAQALADEGVVVGEEDGYFIHGRRGDEAA
jgi:hypothetical protein